MKKLLVIAALAILLLGALVLPAVAQDDLTTLAQYFPVNTPVYVGFSTDDAMIDALDSLAAKFSPLIPGGMAPGDLKAKIDEQIDQLIPGGTFTTTIRSWLGDSAALGLYEFRAETLQSAHPPFTIALSITDKDKAETFFKSLPNATHYLAIQGEGYTLYSPDSSASGDPTIIFRSDVVLLTNDENLAQTGGTLTDSLPQNPDFNSALELLPAASYGGVIYLDTPTLFNVAMQAAMTSSSTSGSSNSAMSDMAQMGNLLSSLVSMVKPEAIGLTLIDNRSLTLDIASPLNIDPNSPLAVRTSITPVDPTFAQHIPAGTPFMVEGTDLYHSGQVAVANLRALMQAMPASANINPQDIETVLWGAGFVVRGLTGLEVDDAFGWMTGSYALYIDFTPAFADSPSMLSAAQHLPVDFGFAIQATDSAAAQKFYDGLARSLVGLPAQGVSVTEETLDSGEKAINFTLTAQGMPYPLELLAATGNGVFAVGTRRMVTAALDPNNVGLDTDSHFIEAGSYMLANPASLFYLDGAGLQPIARMLTSRGTPLSSRETGKQLKALFDLISSASISASVAPDNSSSLVRFVWTLPE